MNQVGLNRAWVVWLLVAVWLLVVAASVVTLLQKRLSLPPATYKRAELTPRGAITTSDGKILAISPRRGERIYPLGTLAGQVVGYNYRVGERYGEGLAGVELHREENLSRGEEVRLTIDTRVQAVAELALAWGMERSLAEWGAVVVLSPNGDILAAANAPFFDPKSRRGKPEEDPRLRNYAFRATIEPGSTVKALTAAVLLDVGAVKLEERIKVPARRRVADRVVRDWRWHPERSWNLKEILAHSSNVGISTLAERISRKTLHRYFQKLHLGDPHLIPGLTERAILPPLSEWGPVEYATATFGQGIAVTPLHLAAAFNALIDGNYYRPRLYADEEPAPAVRVFKLETAKVIREVLAEISQRTVGIPGYRLGGKTGTAQIPIQGGYDPERVVALYAGFIPADRPVATAVVVLYNPQVPPEERYGSKLAAPVFRRLASGVLSLYGVTPRFGNLE